MSLSTLIPRYPAVVLYQQRRMTFTWNFFIMLSMSSLPNICDRHVAMNIERDRNRDRDEATDVSGVARIVVQ